MFQNSLGEMVQKYPSVLEYKHQRHGHLFYPENSPFVTFPIRHVEIDWERLIAQRSLLLKTIDAMPAYLLRPEVLELIALEKDPMHRIIFDLMWMTGARISEVLALTNSSFIEEDGYKLKINLNTIRPKSGRPRKAEQKRSAKRSVTIIDHQLEDCLLSFLAAGNFKHKQKVFPVTRQNVNRHIHALVERVGGAPFSISCKTFRRSFVIHLLLHGRQLKDIRDYLGLCSIESMEIYTNVLTIDSGHFLEGVDFH